MINWILSQQLILSLALTALVLLERHAAGRLGASLIYRLWALVPLLIVANNLPTDIVDVGPSELHRYVVTVGQQATGWQLSVSWQMVWAAGAGAILAFTAWSHWQLVSDSRPARGQTYTQVPAYFNIRSSYGIQSPVIYGIVRPTIALPADFHTRFSHQQQAMILQHEITHYRRGDTLYNLLALLVVALCWFNPLVWFGYAAFRRSQELACDASVLNDKSKTEKVAYSQALLLCNTSAALSPKTYSPYSEKTTMQKRLQQIQRAPSVTRLGKAMTLLISAAMLGGVALASQDVEVAHDKINLATPVYRVEPLYPKEAAQASIQGSVVLKFDIDADGTTSNIEVIKAEPAGVFDANSVTALSQWKYKPRIVGGKAEKQPDMLVQLDYRLEALDKPNTSLVEDIQVLQ